MLKLLLILAACGYGANVLMTSTAVDTTTQSQTTSWIGSVAVKAVSSITGIDSQVMPKTGCTSDGPTEDRLASLLDVFTPEKRDALQVLLDSGASLTSMRWYAGELGTGLCIPSQGQVLLIPPALTTAVSTIVR